MTPPVTPTVEPREWSGFAAEATMKRLAREQRNDGPAGCSYTGYAFERLRHVPLPPPFPPTLRDHAGREVDGKTEVAGPAPNDDGASIARAFAMPSMQRGPVFLDDEEG